MSQDRKLVSVCNGWLRFRMVEWHAVLINQTRRAYLSVLDRLATSGAAESEEGFRTSLGRLIEILFSGTIM